MTLSHDKFIALWQKRIKKGRTHFIIKFALLWGGAMMIFIPLFNIIFDGNYSYEALISQIKINDFYLKAIMFPFAGAVLGYINWNNGIKRYKQIMEVENTNDE